MGIFLFTKDPGDELAGCIVDGHNEGQPARRDGFHQSAPACLPAHSVGADDDAGAGVALALAPAVPLARCDAHSLVRAQSPLALRADRADVVIAPLIRLSG